MCSSRLATRIRFLTACSLIFLGCYVIAAQTAPAPREEKSSSTRVENPQSSSVDAALIQRLEELEADGAYQAAISLAERVLSDYEKKFGADHEETIKVSRRLARLHRLNEGYPRAEQILLRALASTERRVGTQHAVIAEILNELSDVYLAQEDFGKAEAVLSRAVKIQELSSGQGQLNLARSLEKLGNLSQSKQQRETADKFYSRALAILEREFGPDHLDVADLLINRARVVNDESYADQLFDRALAVFDKAGLARNRKAIDHIHQLAEEAEDALQFDLARSMYLRALSVSQKIPVPEWEPTILNNIGELYRKYEMYDEAETFYQEALRKDATNSTSISATTLSNLGLLYKQTGKFNESERLYLRALAIANTSRDLNQVHRTLFNLAKMYLEKGDYAEAILRFESANALTGKTTSVPPQIRGSILVHLAVLYEVTGQLKKAQLILRRVMEEAKTKSLSEWDIGLEYFAISSVFLKHNAPEKAEQVLIRALNISQDIGPPHHVMTGFSEIATAYRMRGNYQKAESFYHRALSRTDETPWDPDLGIILDELAILYQARGQTALAIKTLGSAVANRQSNLWQTLAGEDSHHTNPFSMSGLTYETNIVLSLQPPRARERVGAARLALMTVLLRKGRVLDFLSQSLQEIQTNVTPEATAGLEQLRNLNARLASAALNGPSKTDPILYQAQIAEVEWRVKTLQGRLGLTSKYGETLSDPSQIADLVQERIPNDGALVELALYTPLNFHHSSVDKMWQPPSYVAFVLTRSGPPIRVELGRAYPIDSAVAVFRDALRDPESIDVRTAGRKLDEMVMRPIRAMLGNKKFVLISPDGPLNLIPFAALVDEHGRFLIERYSFTYLTSGRDLITPRKPTPVQSDVIIADPDFGPRASSLPELDVGRRGFDLTGAYFRPLNASAEEARALKTILPDAVTLVKADATETNVKRLKSPRLLHIATHGFFLEDLPKGGAGKANAAKSSVETPERDLTHELTSSASLRIENPLLRSGLGLAGANHRRNSEDDGLLTALEVTALKLTGTKLVVLSACDTGVGEVMSGDGVYGLRRALVLAGAESQVISLWPVSDRHTKDLMIGYYQALQNGRGRGEALRIVQLRFISSAAQNHPFYWASFIQSGDWTVIN